MALIFDGSQLDSKWEFPRERLCIEKVLGEGEFGQVLQAAAIDLPGVAGWCHFIYIRPRKKRDTRSVRGRAGRVEKGCLGGGE